MSTILTFPGCKPVPHDDVHEAEELICDIGGALNDLCNLPMDAVAKAKIAYMGTEIDAEEAMKQLLLRFMTVTHFLESYRLERETRD